MTGDERKRAFKAAAANAGLGLAQAALLHCGVTWEHLGRGISDAYDTPLSAEVKQKFADFIAVPVEEAFSASASEAA